MLVTIMPEQVETRTSMKHCSQATTLDISFFEKMPDLGDTQVEEPKSEC